MPGDRMRMTPSTIIGVVVAAGLIELVNRLIDNPWVEVAIYAVILLGLEMRTRHKLRG